MLCYLEKNICCIIFHLHSINLPRIIWQNLISVISISPKFLFNKRIDRLSIWPITAGTLLMRRALHLSMLKICQNSCNWLVLPLSNLFSILWGAFHWKHIWCFSLESYLREKVWLTDQICERFLQYRRGFRALGQRDFSAWDLKEQHWGLISKTVLPCTPSICLSPCLQDD